MKYRSTRSNIEASSTEAVLNGIALDGGLYVNADMTNIKFDWKACVQMPAQQMATTILNTLLPDFENMEELVKRAYTGKFETEDITPLVKVGENYVLELFRGPTSAFKDVALSMLPQLIVKAKQQLNIKDETVILTATSGDTGKAALEGFHDTEGIKIIVFYPHNGVSAVQKAQMTTQAGKNVKVCAVKGNFDDCQRGVKKAFSNLNAVLKGKRLSSANSINIGRLAPQVFYYFSAYRDLVNCKRIKTGDKVNFVVPTGNFGDILAGFYAKLMGLPVDRLVCASNINNVLTDFINTGHYNRKRPFYKTDSPSMDILVSSNLERLLFIASGNDDEKVSKWMNELNTEGEFSVDEKTLSYIQNSFDAFYCNQEETLSEISSCYKENSYLCDPHTAVAMYAAKRFKEKNKTDNACVVLSTASPYKFPSAILNALQKNNNEDEFRQMELINKFTGVPVPPNLSSLEGKKEVFKDVIEIDEIEKYVLENI